MNRGPRRSRARRRPRHQRLPRAAGPGLLKLDAMENPYGCRPRSRADGGTARGRRRQPLPGSHGRCAQAAPSRGHVDPDSLEIVLGNGSDEILQLVTVALAKPGAAVLSVEPSFAVYKLAARRRGHALRRRAVERRLHARRGEAARRHGAREACAHLDRLSQQSHGQPLFTRRDPAHRRRGAGPCRDRRGYYAFSGGASLLDEVGKHPNLLLVRTVSKLGLAGLRVGLCIAGPRVDARAREASNALQRERAFGCGG